MNSSTKHEPTPDDIERALRKTRAEYIRQVRKVARKQENNDGCFKRLFEWVVICVSIISLLRKG